MVLDVSNNCDCHKNMKSERKRYSRSFVLSRKELSGEIKFPALSIPWRLITSSHPSVPRGTRKLSQSSDQKGHKSQEESKEDLDIDELDGSHAWCRVGRSHNNTGANHQQPLQPPNHVPAHNRQRCTSGSYGDSELTVSAAASTSLRPAPDARRGSHGDWSRGCAGWRQRSYSGSEWSGAGLGQLPRARGTRTLLGVNGEDSHNRGRGRGRGLPSTLGANRLNLPHRGGAGPGRSTQVTYKPTDVVCGLPQSEVSGEFWQEEDWESASPDSSGSGPKSRERGNSFTHSDLPPVVEQISSQTESDHLIQGIANLRAYSKSCSLEPPPGFGIPESTRELPLEIPLTDASQSTSYISCSEVKPASRVTTNKTTSEMPKSEAPTQQLEEKKSVPSTFKWFYVDSTGKIQGPFNNMQMSGWMAAGFLPLAIELRRDCDECFLTLADHMNLAGRVPFWDGYSLKPIKRSNIALFAHALFTSTGHSLGKPQWISNTGQESAPIALVSSPAAHFVPPVASLAGAQNVTLSSDTAVAAAAAATAVLFATATQKAARITAPGCSQSVQQPAVPVPPSVQAVFDTPIIRGVTNNIVGSSSSPIPPPQASVDLVNDNQEFIRLCTEAQALAAHAARVEAERKELAEKIAAINSTAAKLLASAPATDISLLKSVETMLHDDIPKSSSPDQTVKELPVTEVPAPGRAIVFTSEAECDGERTTSNGSSDDPRAGTQVSEHRTDEEPPISSSDVDAFAKPQSTPSISEHLSPNHCDSVDVDENAKKSVKKKNKKTKKHKLSAEQERQLAWEAEFDRRKQVALQRQLAEEAENRRLAEEEAAALAEEQAALAQKQARLLKEQRKREVQRAKADSQLEQLRLPQSARWGTSAACGTSVTHDTQSPSSLLSIQAAQALEEVEEKRREALITEQIVTQLAATDASSTTKPQAWAAVVDTDHKTIKPAVKVRPTTTLSSGSAQVQLQKAAFPNLRGPSERPKSETATMQASQSLKTSTPRSTVMPSSVVVKPLSSSSATISSGTPGVSGTSIWDLPNDGKVDIPSGKSKKQKKKHGNLSGEAASFAAKEELAHWCESQLSSMPLSGVDLPTLVDLLCELEAADQVVEFIESSLGRSKRISKFSKAFLEKRACILNAVP